jgi:hypothetical protein
MIYVSRHKTLHQYEVTQLIAKHLLRTSENCELLLEIGPPQHSLVLQAEARLSICHESRGARSRLYGFVGCGLNLYGPLDCSCEMRKIYSQMKECIIFTGRCSLTMNWTKST